jgi:diguanylate cyclase (GGDEF)-like protein
VDDGPYPGRPRSRAAAACAAGPDSGDERFRAFFEHVPVGVALCSPEGQFRDVNPTARRLLRVLGVDPDTGGLLDLFRKLPAGDGSARRRDLMRVSRGELPVARWDLGPVPVHEPGTIDLREPADGGPAPGPRRDLSPAAQAGPWPVSLGRWMGMTVVRVVLGERGWLLAHLEDTTRRRLERDHLVRLALHDPLTGLANRTLVAQELESALARSCARGSAVGVLYLDLVGFKRVNDTHGHRAGDEILVAVARRLNGSLRASDLAGRLGGDEFLALLGDVADETALGEIARRVSVSVNRPVTVTGARVPVQVSLGAVLSRPDESPADLVGRADAAMYAAKHSQGADPTALR